MTMTRTGKSRSVSRARQQGAALYVALIMLLLLALLGIAGMQVAVMQERMSSNYTASNMAFQRAESLLRDEEEKVESGIKAVPEENAAFSPDGWVKDTGDQANTTASQRVRDVGQATGMCSASVPQSSEACVWVRITVFSRDQANAANASSMAAVDSLYVW